jgi:hypothetical protein
MVRVYSTSKRSGTISIIELDDGSGRLSVVLQPQDTHSLMNS